MNLSGLISELSIPVVLQIIEQIKKTGRLTIIKSQTLENYPNFHIWFIHGKIVAAADRLDGHGLLSMIQEQGWITIRAAARITDVCASNRPAGSCLKEQGLLDYEKLKLLFNQQVLKPTYALLDLQEGRFQFDSTTYLPNLEMTGLTTYPHELMLMAENKHKLKHKISMTVPQQLVA